MWQLQASLSAMLICNATPFKYLLLQLQASLSLHLLLQRVFSFWFLWNIDEETHFHIDMSLLLWIHGCSLYWLDNQRPLQFIIHIKYPFCYQAYAVEIFTDEYQALGLSTVSFCNLCCLWGIRSILHHRFTNQEFRSVLHGA